MTATIMLYDPTAPRGGPSQAAAVPAKKTVLAGAVIGFIDNAKPNFNHLVDDLAELLVSRYGAARVVKRRKSSASIPADAKVIAELSGECDVVIAGSGD
ncbi:MAG: hypothetical protein K2X06_12400 [Burkholderiales bacterium]|nr:hypothetical protein [Burkholderiales bacterium]